MQAIYIVFPIEREICTLTVKLSTSYRKLMCICTRSRRYESLADNSVIIAQSCPSKAVGTIWMYMYVNLPLYGGFSLRTEAEKSTVVIISPLVSLIVWCVTCF